MALCRKRIAEFYIDKSLAFGISSKNLTDEFMKQARKWGCEVKPHTGGSTKLSKGSDILEWVRLRNVTTNGCSDVAVSGAFIYVGQKPRSMNLPRKVACDECGYIITSENMETSVPGIFAAGDVRKKMIRQIATAVGDGAIAARSAEKYLMLSECIIRERPFGTDRLRASE